MNHAFGPSVQANKHDAADLSDSKEAGLFAFALLSNAPELAAHQGGT
jgi:hypothetical protein